VHAFTDLGMSGQLLVYLLFFIWLPAAISIPKGNFKIIYLTLSFSLFAFSLFTGFYKITTVLFISASLGLMLFNLTKATSTKEEEENLSSREFWMFVGALVLLIAAFQITFSTSTPVINKLLSGNVSSFFGWLNGIMPTSLFEKLSEAKLATPKDVVGHYNAWQIPFAIITWLVALNISYVFFKVQLLISVICNRPHLVSK
jgi:cytochrome c-type biogenesis protein CcmF